MNNNKNINYFNTPQLHRQRGDNFVKWISYLVMPKVFKHIKKIDSNYTYEERDKYQNVSPADDIFNQEGEI